MPLAKAWSVALLGIETRYDVVRVFALVGGQPTVRHIAGAF